MAGLIFCGIFALVGLGFFYGFFLRPAMQVWSAGDWPAVECTITHSRVHVNRDSDGDTYRIDIGYRYEYAGQSYASDRYDFLSFMASSGRSGKEAIVRRYPVGQAATCFVNPDDPSEAILSRQWRGDFLFALIPVAFLGIGLIGMVAIWRSGRRKSWATGSAAGASDPQAAMEDWLPRMVRDALRDETEQGKSLGGRETVAAGGRRWGRLVAVTIFALFWNGIISIPISGYFKGDTPVFVALFMIPFALVGLGFMGGIGYMALALFNPRIELTFEPRLVGRGQPLGLRWAIHGRADRFSRLVVTVQGIERASYTRGTDTITDEHQFFETVVSDEERDVVAVPAEGEAELLIPADTMHSFAGAKNKIVWQVQVKGEIPRWPDVKETYEFAVLPDGMATVRRGMF